MKVIYIHHSGFAIVDESCSLLFDYVGGTLPHLPPDKPLYVFVSHAHEDHYNRKIFELRKQYPEIHFIISDDVNVVPDNDVTLVCAHKQYTIGDCVIETLKSTDEGVAFIVSYDQRCIYHAGDLNWWDWGEEDSEEESRYMESAYRQELERIAQRRFTVAMVPYDPRLAKAAPKGLITFMRYADADYIFPMHFWRDYSVFKDMKSLPFHGKIVEIRQENECFQL